MNQKQFHKLVEAISQLGLDNVTSLADYAGIPTETARYMIWRELPRHFVSVGVDVNFEAIGLKQWMIRISLGRNLEKDALAGFFHDEIGLTTLISPMISNSITLLVAVPHNQHFKLERILQYLVTSEIIKEYSMKEIEWSRHVSFDPSHYDFQARSWAFDWKNIELESMIKKTAESENPLKGVPQDESTNKIDQRDLLILRALQRKVPRAISKLTNIIGSDQHSLRYHYNRHVKYLIRGYYLKILPHESIDRQNLFFFVYKPRNVQDFVEARRIALSLPFTTTEWRTDSEYAWLAQWPGEFANSAFKYLDKKFARLAGSLEHFLIDSETELTQLIPCELFDNETRSWKYEPKKKLGIFVTRSGGKIREP
ncbi:MAG: hypothetical protein ACYC7D_10630 [Nitrososphaerales archaeon]